LPFRLLFLWRFLARLCGDPIESDGDDAPRGPPSWELEKIRASGLNEKELQLLLEEVRPKTYYIGP